MSRLLPVQAASDGLSSSWPPSAREVELSPREVECIRLIARGLTDQAIGRIMGVQRCTIRFHLKNICHKLGVPNRCAAVYKAATTGKI